MTYNLESSYMSLGCANPAVSKSGSELLNRTLGYVWRPGGLENRIGVHGKQKFSTHHQSILKDTTADSECVSAHLQGRNFSMSTDPANVITQI